LAILLRTEYYQRAIRAIRAITTGHSNRRRTQDGDFLALPVFLPAIDIQKQLAWHVVGTQEAVKNAEGQHALTLARVEKVVLGHEDPLTVLVEA